MNFLVVMGMSGAGKSRTMSVLEDLGYICVDNMPGELIYDYYNLKLFSEQDKNKNFAIVVDIKGGESFYGIFETLNRLKIEDKPYKILFIDARDDVIIRRYSEDRKKHPLDQNSKISSAIATERKILEPIKSRADYTIENSDLTPSQLKKTLIELFLERPSDSLTVNCMSFGFKYGIPAGVDTVIDVRCFPNPFYDEELRELTGLDEKLRDFVLQKPEMQKFLGKFFDLYDFLLPLYRNEGKTQMVIAVGCTGGKHRSVAVAQQLYEHLKSKNFKTNVYHRDINKKLKVE